MVNSEIHHGFAQHIYAICGVWSDHWMIAVVAKRRNEFFMGCVFGPRQWDEHMDVVNCWYPGMVANLSLS